MAKTINAILNLQNKFSGTLSEAKKDTLKFKAQMSSCDNRAAKFEEGLGKIGTAAKKGFAIATAATVGFAASSVNSYKEFEQSMSNVAGTMAITKTSEEYATLETAARQAGATTTKTASEAADALNYMALAGWDVEQSTKGLLPMLRAAEASGADLGTVSDLVTDSMSAWGLTVDDMTNYLDVASKAQSKSNTNLLQFQEATIGVGGTFKSFNVGLSEGGALLGVLANRGIKGSEAGNALQSTLINLTKKSGESYKAMSALGISAYDSQGKFKGVTAVLSELNEKTKGLTEEQRNTYLTMIGGKNQLTTLNALMAGLNTKVSDGRSELEYLTAELGNADGSLEQLSNTMTDNINGAWEGFTGALDEAQISIGKEFAPYVQSFLEWLTSKIPAVQEKVVGFIQAKLPGAVATAKSWFENLKPVVSWVIDHWQELAIVGGGVITFMKGFSVANNLYSGLSAINKGAQGATMGAKLTSTAMTALNTSFLACPITWIVAGIVAAGAALILLSKKSERLRGALSNTWGIIKGFGADIKSKFVNAFKEVKSAFAGVEPSLKSIGDAAGWLIDNALNPLLNKLLNFGGDIIGSGLNILVGAFKGAADIIKGIGSAIDMVKAIANGDAKSALKNLGLTVVNVFGSVGSLLSGMPGPLGAIGNKIVWLKDKAIDFINGGWRPFVQNIRDGVTSALAKIDEFKNLAKQKLTDAFSGIKGLYDKYISPLVASFKGLIDRIKEIKNSLGEMPVIGGIIGQNALGTRYWRGGPTWVNERGGEILDLPSGTRIYPHDVSKQMVNNNNNSKNITLNVYVQGGGSDKETGNRVAREILLALEGI